MLAAADMEPVDCLLLYDEDWGHIMLCCITLSSMQLGCLGVGLRSPGLDHENGPARVALRDGMPESSGQAPLLIAKGIAMEAHRHSTRDLNPRRPCLLTTTDCGAGIRREIANGHASASTLASRGSVRLCTEMGRRMSTTSRVDASGVRLFNSTIPSRTKTVRSTTHPMPPPRNHVILILCGISQVLKQTCCRRCSASSEHGAVLPRWFL